MMEEIGQREKILVEQLMKSILDALPDVKLFIPTTEESLRILLGLSLNLIYVCAHSIESIEMLESLEFQVQENMSRLFTSLKANLKQQMN